MLRSALSLRVPVHVDVRFRQLGVGLVEVMIGLLIGMIALLVMLQMLSSSEGQKRTTLGADDAQNTGAIALYSLQRDLKQAGHGISERRVIGCELTGFPGGADLPVAAPVIINPPAAVVPAGDANSDTLLVMYGTAAGSSRGAEVLDPADVGTPAALKAVVTAANEVYYMWSPDVFQATDRIFVGPLLRPVGACSYALAEVGDVVVLNPGVNAPTATEGFVYNLGALPRVVAYRVDSGNLTSCDYVTQDCTNGANYEVIANHVVSMRAQYGRDTGVGDLDGIVDLYDQTTPASACDWLRVSAVRFVVVVRSAQVSGVVTAAAPVWAGSGTHPVNLTANATWQNYRYRTFETVVPLRNNLAWPLAQTSAVEPTGCP